MLAFASFNKCIVCARDLYWAYSRIVTIKCNVGIIYVAFEYSDTGVICII